MKLKRKTLINAILLLRDNDIIDINQYNGMIELVFEKIPIENTKREKKNND